MAQARFNQVGVDIDATTGTARYRLRATGRTMIFDGHLRVYSEGRDDGPDEEESRLPELAADQLLALLEVLPEQHFTQPPPRFTEASLVKTLEELGIGRPSTYASIISTIQDRGYVRLEDRRFFPNDVGEVVTDKLVEHFPDIVNVNFTAEMEEDLDEIAEGDLQRVQVLRQFYVPFADSLDRAEEKFERFVEELDEDCPRCIEEGRTPPGRLQKRLGRYGFFIGCTRFAEEDGGCKYIRNLDGQERPEPGDARRDLPGLWAPAAAEVRSVRSVRRLLRVPGVPVHQEGPSQVDGRDLPAVQAGRDRREADPVRPDVRVRALPGLRLRRQPPADRGSTVPECGSLLIRRPKSLRCWGCGAELDDAFNVTKSGDPVAEAEARRRRRRHAGRAAAKQGRRRPPPRRPPPSAPPPSARRPNEPAPSVPRPSDPRRSGRRPRPRRPRRRR